jgi:hypothetical protein
MSDRPSNPAARTGDPARSLFDSADGATPIDAEVAAGLKADWLATRGELNAAEQQNIFAAVKLGF